MNAQWMPNESSTSSQQVLTTGYRPAALRWHWILRCWFPRPHFTATASKKLFRLWKLTQTAPLFSSTHRLSTAQFTSTNNQGKPSPIAAAFPAQQHWGVSASPSRTFCTPDMAHGPAELSLSPYGEKHQRLNSALSSAGAHKTPGWVRLNGSTVITRPHLPAQGGSSQSTRHGTVSGWLWDISAEGHSTASLGKLFQ